MSGHQLTYYTIEPCPKVQPVSLIVRVYGHPSGHKNCLGSYNVPICNPSMISKAYRQAHELGDALIAYLGLTI